MEDKEEAKEAIREAEEEKQEAMDEAKEEGVELPPDVFTKFDRLLTQAKELFARENYQGAEQLAEQAEDAIENVEDIVEKLEEENDDKEDDDEKDTEDKDNKEDEKEDEDLTQEISKEVLITLSSQNNSGESGTAELKSDNEKTKVKLDLDGAPKTSQPAHIHVGSCANLGGVKYPLTSPVDGESETILNVSLT